MPCTQSVVFNNQYHPVFWLPPDLNILDSALEGCWIDIPVTDPPVALPTADFPTKTADAQPGVTPDLIPLPTVTFTGMQPTPTLDPEPPVITVGPPAFPFVPDPNRDEGVLIIDPGTTIKQRGPAATIGQTTVSIGESGIVISDKSGSRVLPLPNDASMGDSRMTIPDGSATRILPIPTGVSVVNNDPAQIKADGVISIDGHKFTADAAGNLVKPGTTLHVGDTALTVSGTTLSVGADGRATLIDSDGRTTVIDNQGIMSISDSTGRTTVKHPSGTIIIIDTNGGKTIVDESGRTSFISPDGATTRIQRGGLFATIVATGTAFSVLIRKMRTNLLVFIDTASAKKSGSKSSKAIKSNTNTRKIRTSTPAGQKQADSTAVPTQSKKGGADTVRLELWNGWCLWILGLVIIGLYR